MRLKDLISHGYLQIKTKIKSEGERFIVGFKLDLSKEELAMLGLEVPRKRGGKVVAKQPSLKETVDTLKDSVESLRVLVIKGFEQVNKDLSELKQDVALIKSLPTIARELEAAKAKDDSH